MLFTDIKSLMNVNTIGKKSHVDFEMSISPLSLCLGWRELPIFLFPVFGALPAPTEGGGPCLFKSQNSTDSWYTGRFKAPLPKKDRPWFSVEYSWEGGVTFLWPEKSH